MSSPLRLSLVLVVAALVTGAGFVALRDNERGETENRSRPTAGPDPATALLYLEDFELRRIDLVSGEVETMGTMPTKDVYASPSSTWIAYVVEGEPSSEEAPDFVAAPELRIADSTSDTDVEIGPGFNPLWHQAAPRFAYLRPAAPRRCSAEACFEDLEVVTFDVETRHERVLTEPGRYSLLAWLGERVVVADERDLSISFSIGPEGGVEELDVTPSELWDSSPDGRYLVTSSDGGPWLTEIATGRRTAIETGGGVLAEGEWSPDSERFASVLLDATRTRSSVVVVDARDGSITRYTRPRNAVLGMVWSADGNDLGFLTFVGATNRTEINRCAVDAGEPSCEVVGEPLRRATLLRFES